MPFTIYAIDEEFAAATGSNVNATANTSVFDNPPNAFANLTITTNEGDSDPRLFEIGDTYDLNWGGFGGGGTIEDAVVVRSDPAPGNGGIVVFEGLDEHGEITQIIWTPGFNLEDWYWDSYNPSAEPQFYVEDINAGYTHGFVCFAEETRIATALGGIAAGDLWAGDRVGTLDAGAQPVLWVGRRQVPGRGADAPVLFTPGAIGNFAPLRLSQQHRVLVRSAMAELMFGASEVLVPAKAMVNGEDIRIDLCPRVDYVHVLLPAHHIVMAEGAACKSLLPGEVSRNRADLPRRVAHRRYAPARPILSYAEAIALLGTGPDPAVRRCGARRARVKGPAL